VKKGGGDEPQIEFFIGGPQIRWGNRQRTWIEYPTIRQRERQANGKTKQKATHPPAPITAFFGR
jgi:hypothetical protein